MPSVAKWPFVLNVVMPIVIILNVIMLSVAAPRKKLIEIELFCKKTDRSFSFVPFHAKLVPGGLGLYSQNIFSSKLTNFTNKLQCWCLANLYSLVYWLQVRPEPSRIKNR